MSKKREYDEEYKEQAVRLAKNLGSAKAAAEELQIPVNTLYGWIQEVKTAERDIGCGERSPEEALSMRTKLSCETLNHANLRFPEIRGAIVHSDRGSQYTSAAYRAVIQKYGIVQSMNSAGGRCHDNARCESIWARMKEELFYHQGQKTEHYKMEELKFMVWRYFMSYWSNRRICSSIGGLPPAVKRQRFYAAVAVARFAS